MGILTLLKPLQGGIVCITGAGGKTSLMYRLAEEIERAGQTAICTTTERLLPPPPGYYMVAEDNANQVERPANIPFVIAGRKDPENSRRYLGYTPEEIASIYAKGQADWVLVEVGPSLGRSVLAHNPGAIKYPAGTKAVIGMIGLSAIGKDLDDVWVTGAENFAKISGQDSNGKVTEQAIANFATDANGIFMDAPAEARKILFLNQADISATREAGCRVAELILKISSAAPGAQAAPVLEGVGVGAALSGAKVVYEYFK